MPSINISDGVAIIALVFSCISFIHTLDNNKRINKQNEINARASIMPFLDLVLDEKKTHSFANGCNFRVGLKNIGNAAAVDIRIMGDDSPNNESESKEALKHLQQDLNYNYVMVGNEVNFVLSFKLDEMNKCFPYGTVLDGHRREANIIFSLNYSDLLGNEYKQSDYKVTIEVDEDKETISVKDMRCGRMKLIKAI
ncbi:hypothetical protein [Oribacterium sp.]